VFFTDYNILSRFLVPNSSVQEKALKIFPFCDVYTYIRFMFKISLRSRCTYYTYPVAQTELGESLRNGVCQEVGWNNSIKHRDRVGMEIALLPSLLLSLMAGREGRPFSCLCPLCAATLIKKKIKFFSYIGKLRMEQLQSHV
jgi:hypothetical protein